MRELNREIEEKIALCEQRYEENKEDSFLSVILDSELRKLQTLYGRIRNEMPADQEKMLAELKAEFAELEKDREREEHSPTFDWYDEHYHYKVLDGQCDAYRSVIGILERYCL